MIIDAVLRMQPNGFDALMQLLEEAGCRIKRGAQISIKPPEGERYIRLDTLGQEYDEASLRRTLARDHVHIPKIPRGDYSGIPLIIAPKPSTSSPLTRISRKSVIQVHYLYAK